MADLRPSAHATGDASVVERVHSESFRLFSRELANTLEWVRPRRLFTRFTRRYASRSRAMLMVRIVGLSTDSALAENSRDAEAGRADLAQQREREP